MRTKLLLSADTPCDIGAELQKRYDVQLFPLHILLGSKTYTDGLDINNEALYDAWRKERLLPKTAAINPEEYINYFRPFIEDGFEILHISLGSGLSCCYQNAVIAASELGHVRVIDSRNLSSGFGHLVCEAGERINAGYSLDQIVGEVEALVPKVSASFVLDTLEFMHAGGRCSNFAQLGATLMRLKPSIEVLQSQCGGMVVGRKYIGKLDSALKNTSAISSRIERTSFWTAHLSRTPVRTARCPKRSPSSYSNYSPSARCTSRVQAARSARIAGPTRSAYCF